MYQITKNILCFSSHLQLHCKRVSSRRYLIVIGKMGKMRIVVRNVVRILPVQRSACLLIQVRYRKGPLSQKSAGHMQNRKTKTNTNPSPDPNRYIRRCPDPNAWIQKFIHYMAIATFAIADLCDSGLKLKVAVSVWHSKSILHTTNRWLFTKKNPRDKLTGSLLKG